MKEDATDLLFLREIDPNSPELRVIAARIISAGLRDERLGL